MSRNLKLFSLSSEARKMFNNFYVVDWYSSRNFPFSHRPSTSLPLKLLPPRYEKKIFCENLFFVVFHISITALLKLFRHSWCRGLEFVWLIQFKQNWNTLNTFLKHEMKSFAGKLSFKWRIKKEKRNKTLTIVTVLSCTKGIHPKKIRKKTGTFN